MVMTTRFEAARGVAEASAGSTLSGLPGTSSPGFMTRQRRRKRLASKTVSAARETGRARYYGWKIVGALSLTETVSWGILFYAFSIFLVPMRQDLGWSS